MNITSGVLVNDIFYLKPRCKCSVPKLCSLINNTSFIFKNNIPTSGIPSGDVNVALTTYCPGVLPLLDNNLDNFTTDLLIENKKYQVLPVCISGVSFGQVIN